MAIQETQFAHLIGRIRSMETQMLNENETERMLLSSNVKEAFKILNETSYSNHVLDVTKAGEFQTVLDNELLDTANFLKKLCPQSEYLNVLWYTYDVHNVKTLLKGKLDKVWAEDIDALLSPLGSLDLERLKAYFRTEGAHFPETVFENHKVRFVETIKEVEAMYGKTEDYQMIDLMFDKLHFELSVEVAKDSGDAFLIEFMRKNVDLFNIGALFRLKFKGAETQDMSKVFAEGGLLDVAEFTKLAAKDVAEIPALLKDSHYKQIGKTIVEEFETQGSMIKIDEVSQNHLTDFIKTAKSVAYGIAPVVAFFWAKNNNAQIIRMILLAKIAGIKADVIKPHIRTLY